MEDRLSSSSSGFVGDGSVDLHGRSVSRAHTGRWKASLLIIGVEVAERFAYTGIRSNLVTYLTDVLDESTVNAAKNVNTWSGVASMLPFLGAFVADSYLGRYWTIVSSSVIYLIVSIFNLMFLFPKSFQKHNIRGYTAISARFEGNYSTKIMKNLHRILLL